MHATAVLPLVGADLAKSVFQLAVADSNWRTVERARLTRSQFERWFGNGNVGRVVMEARGGAHHWARWLARLGIAVRLLPPPYVRAFVKCLRDALPYGQPRSLDRKILRSAYSIPA